MSDFFFRFARFCTQILRRRRSPTPGKIALIFTYVRLLLKRLVLVRLLGRRLCHERIFGYRVHFFDYRTFVFLFKEVFLYEDYYFQARSPRPFVLDCGANIGMALLYIKLLYPQARIVSFEPDETTFVVLQKNVQENRLQDVTLLNAALSNQDGETEFFFDPAKPGALTMSIHQTRMPKSSRRVKTLRLSSYVEDHVDFLKIDVEGAEKLVLDDLAQERKLERISEMVIEYHHHFERDEDNLSSFLKILETGGLGYQLAVEHWTDRGAFQDILIYAYANPGAVESDRHSA